MIENRKPGQRIQADQEFCFECKPRLSCFNTCCRDKRLPLWPYDLLRLRSALGLNSAQVLEKYAELEFDPVSGWPALRIRLTDEGACSFLSPEGCTVYHDRPAACRVYPLGRMAAPGRGKGRPEVIYERQQTRNCQGWRQERQHTIDSWNRDQGLEPYNQANDSMLPLLFHPKREGKLELSPQQIHAVIAALYNLDVFRQMLESPALKDMFDSARLKAAQSDDLAVLDLGRDFLIKTLFKG